MRKKILRTILAAALLSTLFTVTAYAENAVITGDNVNLRSGPGMNYKVIGSIPRGASVKVEDRSNEEWNAITYDGTYGFISANLMSITEDPSAVQVVATDGFGRVNAMYVRFRSGPSDEASILGEYNVGKEATITGIAGDWTECIIDGRSGFVNSDYIDVETNGAVAVIDLPQTGGALTATVKPESTPTPTAAPKATPAPTAAPTPAPTAAPVVKSVANQAGYVDGDYVSFRSGPSNSSAIINTYNRGKELTLTGTSGDWSVVSIDGQSGYMFSSYVKTFDSAQGASGNAAAATPAPRKGDAGYITGNHVQFRGGPAMTSKNLGEFFYGDIVTIYGTSGDWTELSYKGTTGYVFSTYVAKGEFKTESSKVATGEKITGREVADFALNYVGYNYRWGGESPATGFDCSGFTSFVYKQFGYELDRVACDQAKNGRAVSKEELQPGDILCFYSSGSYIGHVGLYIGDNMFVHAANSSSGVITSSVTGYYATRGFVARRIL